MTVAALCVRYLTDEHPSCHGEPGARGEVGGDHDPQAGLRERQLVGAEDEEFIHHDDRRRLLTSALTYDRRCFINNMVT